jgi:hypothetical protein
MSTASPSVPEARIQDQETTTATGIKTLSIPRLRPHKTEYDPGLKQESPLLSSTCTILAQEKDDLSFFGPFQYNNWDEEHKTRYELFLRKAIQHMTPPLAIQERYRITSYVKSQEELDRMSSNWIRNRGNEKTIAVTLETSWNTPNSTISGYESVGRKLGLAVTAYFRETLRED